MATNGNGDGDKKQRMESARTLLSAAAAALSAICLFVLSSISSSVQATEDRVRAHVMLPEIHETHNQKSSSVYRFSREAIREWDEEVGKPRWQTVLDAVRRIEENQRKAGSGK